MTGGVTRITNRTRPDIARAAHPQATRSRLSVPKVPLSLPLAHRVPEGSVPPGTRPAPGPRPARDIWAGAVDAPAPEAPSVFGRARLTGLDAARGLALFGMIAVHTLPAENEITGDPTLAFSLFGGRSAALFAVLAGVALAFMTGRTTPRRGYQWWRNAASLLIRAVLIFVLGIGLNHLDLPVYNILPYYGLLVLVDIPFTRLGAAWNLILAGIVAVVGPVAIHQIVATTSAPVVAMPKFQDLASQPVESVLSFLVTETYPAFSWLAFVLVGLGLGRLDLRNLRSQANAMIVGGLLALAAPTISGLLLNNADRWRRIAAEADGLGLQDVISIDAFGPPDEQPLPTSTWWWLALDGPHTNTPLFLLAGVGTSLMVIGAALLICRAIEDLLTPLIAAGSMTLTLYTSHLVLMSLVDTDPHHSLWLAIQVVVAAVFATVWMVALGRGPLESVVSAAAALPTRGRRRKKKYGKHAVV